MIMRILDGTIHGSPEVVERTCYLWCPGCDSIHPFRIMSTTGKPTWTWDGNTEAPTFGPSLLVHGSVHRCAGEHLVECSGIDCGHVGHRSEGGKLYTAGPHTADPPWGDCHSFLRVGRWEFLGDCAHALAGQTVDVVPLPDWWAGLHEEDEQS